MIGVLDQSMLLADPSMTWTGQREADRLARVGRILGSTMLPGGAASPSAVYATVATQPAPTNTAVMVGAAVLGLAAVAAVIYKIRKRKKK
jgi:hypothetical protein